MNPLEQELLEKFAWRQPKEVLAALCQDVKYHQPLREICISDNHNYNWRAAWILNGLSDTDLQKLFPKTTVLIQRLLWDSPRDGYYREVFKLIHRLPLNEEEEGELYDAALKIWENLSYAPAVRAQALYALARIAKLYPELQQEILAYQDDHFLQGISPGILKQIQKLFSSLG